MPAIEPLVVSKIIEEQSLVEATRAGIKPAYFNGEWETIYQFILDYNSQHGHVPSERAFRTQWGDIEIEDTSSESFSGLFDELLDAYRFRVVAEAMTEASGALDRDVVKDAIASLSHGLLAASADTARLTDFNLVETWEERVDRYQYLHDNPDSMLGISTGFASLDRLLHGFQEQQFVVIGGEPKRGKANPYGTPVLTPAGWRNIEDLSPGDYITAPDGTAKAVTHVWDWGEMDVFDIAFNDGTSAQATAEHDWCVRDKNLQRDRRLGRSGQWRKVETSSLLDSPRNILKMVDPIEMPPVEHVVDPYLLGALIGDGSLLGTGGATLTSADSEVVEAARASYELSPRGRLGYYLRGSKPDLVSTGLWGKRSWEKNIPEDYLRGTVAQRFATLQGLLDTDGGMEGNSLRFTTTSPQLASDVQYLVRSLGGVCTSNPKQAYSQDGPCRVCYRLTLRLPASLGSPFRIERKTAMWDNGNRKRPPSKRAIKVTPAGRKEVRCLTVEGGLYVLNDFTVTHNSTVSLIMSMAAQSSGYEPLFVSFEMTAAEQSARYDAILSGVSHEALMSGNATQLELDKVRRSLSMNKNAKDFMVSEDASGLTTVGAVAAKAREYMPKILFVDGLYLMDDEHGEKKGSPQAITNITRGFKRLAQSLQIPIVGTTQVLPSKVHNSKTRSVTADAFGYSSSFAQDADVLIAAERDPDIDNQSILRIVEARNAPRAEIKIAWNWATMEFHEVDEVDEDDDFDDIGFMA